MEESLCRFYLLRHGESEGNALGLIQGQCDYALTAKGVEASLSLAHEFADISFDAIYTSDLRRAEETAKIIAEPQHVDFHVEPLLREGSYGSLEGKSVEWVSHQYKKSFQYFNTLPQEERFSFKLVSDGDSLADIYTRVNAFLAPLSQQYLGGNVLIVTHGWVLRSFLVRHQYLDERFVSEDNLAYLCILMNVTSCKIEKVHGLSPALS